MKQDWRETLIDMIELEIECATGLPSSDTHASDTCRMNDILKFVEGVIKKEKKK